MKIIKLYIEHFGKIKDLQIELQEGLNILYGVNESGKSTIQSFIKSMLYGMNSQKKSIRENDRKRFIPWDAAYASGELYFEDDHQNIYLIKRKFGKRKKEDESTILNVITGEEVGYMDFDKPGIAIFNLGEEAFEKTIFIKQLGAKVIRDKEDEIMKYLVNLQQSGDEDISYHGAVEMLQNEKKHLSNQRKTGKLDQARVDYEKLQEEWGEGYTLQEKNIEDEGQLNKMLEAKLRLEEEIKRIEICKQHQKWMVLEKEYKQLCMYLEKIKTLSKEKEEIHKELGNQDVEIEESFMEALREKHTAWILLKQEKNKLEEEQETIAINRKEKQQQLEQFEAYAMLDEDILFQIAWIESEKENIGKALQNIEWNQQELKRLEYELRNEVRNLGNLAPLEKVDEVVEKDIMAKEEKRKKLQHQLDDNGQREALNLRNDIVKQKIKGLWALISIGVLVFLCGIMLVGIKGNWFYGLCILGILICSYALVYKHKFLLEQKKIGEEKILDGKIQAREKEIDAINLELNEIYYKLGVQNYTAFRMAIRKYGEKKDKIVSLKVQMKERIRQIDEMKKGHLKEKREKFKTFINTLLKKCCCATVDEFKIAFENYHKLVLERESLEKDWHHIQEAIHSKKNKLEGIEKELIEKLQALGIKNISVDQISKIIHNLSEKYKQKRKLENEITSLQATYQAILGNRDIDDMRKELENATTVVADSSILYGSDFETLLKEKQQHLIALEKNIKDVEYVIKERFHQKRSIVEIEEEMDVLNQDIEDYHEIGNAIDIALVTLEDSFKEIQRNFGPRLNQVVGDILEKITNGKYSALKISDDYKIKVIDPIQNQIREVDYFSNGTWDQVYFSLRMGIAKLIFQDKVSVPILLDDAFVQYDDARLEAVLNYLYTYAKKNQVILFTCQKREVDRLQSLSKTCIINL